MCRPYSPPARSSPQNRLERKNVSKPPRRTPELPLSRLLPTATAVTPGPLGGKNSTLCYHQLATFPNDESQSPGIPAHTVTQPSHCALASPTRADADWNTTPKECWESPLRALLIPLHQPHPSLLTFYCLGTSPEASLQPSSELFLKHCNQCTHRCTGLSLELLPSPAVEMRS